MTRTAHCAAQWFVRCCPGVIAGFAAAYGEQDLVAGFDRMSVNLPTSSGNPAALRAAAVQHSHGKLNASGLDPAPGFCLASGCPHGRGCCVQYALASRFPEVGRGYLRNLGWFWPAPP